MLNKDYRERFAKFIEKARDKKLENEAKLKELIEKRTNELKELIEKRTNELKEKKN